MLLYYIETIECLAQSLRMSIIGKFYLSNLSLILEDCHVEFELPILSFKCTFCSLATRHV